MTTIDFNQFCAASEAFVSNGDRHASQFIENLLSSRCQPIKAWYDHLTQYNEDLVEARNMNTDQNSNNREGHSSVNANARHASLQSADMVFAHLIDTTAFIADLVSMAASHALKVNEVSASSTTRSSNGRGMPISPPLLMAVLLLKKFCREWLPQFVAYEKRMRYFAAGRRRGGGQNNGAHPSGQQGNTINYETAVKDSLAASSYGIPPQIPSVNPSTVSENFSWILQAVVFDETNQFGCGNHVPLPIPFTTKLLSVLVQLRTLIVDVLVALISHSQAHTLHIGGGAALGHQSDIPITVWSKNPIVKMLFHVIGVLEIFIWAEEPLAGGEGGKKYSHTVYNPDDNQSASSSAMTSKFVEVCQQIFKFEICGNYTELVNTQGNSTRSLSSPNIIENVMAHFTSTSSSFFEKISTSVAPSSIVGFSNSDASTLSLLAPQLASRISYENNEHLANTIVGYYHRISSQLFIADRLGALSASGLESQLQALGSNQNNHPQYQNHQHPLLQMTSWDASILGTTNIFSFVLYLLRNVVEALVDPKISIDFMLRAKVRSSMQLGAVPLVPKEAGQQQAAASSSTSSSSSSCMCAAILTFMETGLQQLLSSHNGIMYGNQNQATLTTFAAVISETTKMILSAADGSSSPLSYPVSPYWATSLAAIIFFVQLCCETLSLAIGAAMETASLAGQIGITGNENSRGGDYNFRKNENKKTSKPVSPWGESFWLMLAPLDPSTTFPSNEATLLSNTQSGADTRICQSLIWDFILKSGFVTFPDTHNCRPPLMFSLAAAIKGLSTNNPSSVLLSPQFRVLADRLSDYVNILGSPSSPSLTSSQNLTQQGMNSITLTSFEECPMLEVSISDVIVKLLEVISLEGACYLACMAPASVDSNNNNQSNNHSYQQYNNRYSDEQQYEEAHASEEYYFDICSVASAAIVRGLRFVQPPGTSPVPIGPNANVSCKPLFHAVFMGIAEAAVPLLNATTEKYVSESISASCSCCANQYVAILTGRNNNDLPNPSDITPQIIENGNLSLKTALFVTLQTTLSHVITDPVAFSVTPPIRAFLQQNQAHGQQHVLSSHFMPATAVVFPLISLLTQRSQAVTATSPPPSGSGYNNPSASGNPKGSISIGRVLDIRLCAALELISPSLSGLTMVAQALAPQSIPPFDEEADDPEDFGLSVVDVIDGENVRKRLTIAGLFSANSSHVTEERLQAPFLLTPDSFFLAATAKVVAHLITSFANAMKIEREIFACENLLSALNNNASSNNGSARSGSLLLSVVLSFLATSDDSTLLYGSNFHETVLHHLSLSITSAYDNEEASRRGGIFGDSTANGTTTHASSQKELPISPAHICSIDVSTAEQLINSFTMPATNINVNASPSASAFHKGLVDIHKHTIAAFISCFMHLSTLANSSITTRRSILAYIICGAFSSLSLGQDIPLGRSANNSSQPLIGSQSGCCYMTAHDDEDRNGTHLNELQRAASESNGLGSTIVPFVVDLSSQTPETIVQNLIALNASSTSASSTSVSQQRTFTSLQAIHMTVLGNLSNGVSELEAYSTRGEPIDIAKASRGTFDNNAATIAHYLASRSNTTETNALSLLLEAACIPSAFTVLKGSSSADTLLQHVQANVDVLPSDRPSARRNTSLQELNKQVAESFSNLWLPPTQYSSTAADSQSAKNEEGTLSSIPFPSLLSQPSVSEVNQWLNRLKGSLAFLRNDALNTIPNQVAAHAQTDVNADATSLGMVLKSLLADFLIHAQTVEIYWHRAHQVIIMMMVSAERVLAGEEVLNATYGHNYNGHGWPLWLQEEYYRASALLEVIGQFWSWLGNELYEVCLLLGQHTPASQNYALPAQNMVAIACYRDLICRLATSTANAARLASEDQLRFHVPSKVKSIILSQRDQRKTYFVQQYAILCVSSFNNNNNPNVTAQDMSVTTGDSNQTNAITEFAEIILYSLAKPIISLLFHAKEFVAAVYKNNIDFSEHQNRLTSSFSFSNWVLGLSIVQFLSGGSGATLSSGSNVTSLNVCSATLSRVLEATLRLQNPQQNNNGYRGANNNHFQVTASRVSMCVRPLVEGYLARTLRDALLLERQHATEISNNNFVGLRPWISMVSNAIQACSAILRAIGLNEEQNAECFGLSSQLTTHDLLSPKREEYLLELSNTLISASTFQRVTELAFSERQRQEHNGGTTLNGNNYNMFDSPSAIKVSLFAAVEYLAALLSGGSSPIAFSATHLNLIVVSGAVGNPNKTNDALAAGATVTSGWLTHISSTFYNFASNAIISTSPAPLQQSPHAAMHMGPACLLLHPSLLGAILGTAVDFSNSPFLTINATQRSNNNNSNNGHDTLMSYMAQLWLPTLEAFAIQVGSLVITQPPPELQPNQADPNNDITRAQASRIETLLSIAIAVQELFGPKLLRLLKTLARMDGLPSSSSAQSTMSLLSNFSTSGFAAQKVQPAILWVLNSCLAVVEQNLTYMSARLGHNEQFRFALSKVALETTVALTYVAEFYQLVCSGGTASQQQGTACSSLDIVPVSDILCSAFTLNLMKLIGIGAGGNPSAFTSPPTSSGHTSNEWQKGILGIYFETKKASDVGLGDEEAESSPQSSIPLPQLRRNEAWHSIIKSCLLASLGQFATNNSHRTSNSSGGLGSAVVTLFSNPGAFVVNSSASPNGINISSVQSFHRLLSAVIGASNPHDILTQNGAVNVYMGEAQTHINFVLNRLRTANDVDEVASLFEQLCIVVSLVFA